MLGWNISVYRQHDGGQSPAPEDSEQGARIAVWEIGSGGLHWMNELVKAGKAVFLGGNGYPLRYTAVAEHVIPLLVDKPPWPINPWAYGTGTFDRPVWFGENVIDHALAAQCADGEWLLIVAWDLS
jgi:hypothetical protein